MAKKEVKRQATIQVTWVKSVSTDVTLQKFRVINQTDAARNVSKDDLPPETQQFQFAAFEKDDLTISVTASDGTNDSPPLSQDFTVGDLTGPLAPTGLTVSIIGTEEIVT